MLARIRHHARTSPRLTTALRWAAALSLLGLTLAWLDLPGVLERLRGAHLPWLVAALLLSIPLVGALAWRWSFTAQRMGVNLPLRVAWREYYVSTLLNSVLPGGVVGDVVRVTRQAGSPGQSLGPLARSVVFERAVGQVVLWLAVLLSAVVWGLDDAAVAILASLLGLIGSLVVLAWLGTHPRIAPTGPGRLIARVRQELRAALLDRQALAVQLLTSLASLAALIATFYCCAAAIESSMTASQALLIVPGVLAATTLPLTVGGWGVRELSAVTLFELASIPAEEGAASAMLFGAIGLLSALPGLLPLTLGRRSAAESPR